MWDYASPRFWREALLSTLPESPPDAPPLAFVGEEYPGVVTGDCYTSTLAFLARHRELNETQARTLLAHAKCMRKWAIAPADFTSARREAALDGFLERNDATGALGGTSLPPMMVLKMRRLLERWLPKGAAEGKGRFGPGACAEHLSHAKRYTHLADWVLSSDKWPSVPIGDSDMDLVTARLCAVPKQYDKDRLITVEPAYATFAQQAARETLLNSIHKGPLKGTCMDLGFTDGPTIQRRLALQASLNGINATIDLKDASDNISLADFEAVFPSWVQSLCLACRSTHVVRDGSEPRVMHMYAGMGNATTFVVETLFFSAYVVAFAENAHLPVNVSTFGDDIICNSKTARSLIEVGQCPCFRINADKSFLEDDALRESCGVFAFLGKDVTVPRFNGYTESESDKSGLATLCAQLSVDNLFYGVAHAIAANGGLPNYERWVAGFPSVSIPSVPYAPLPKTRWNPHLCNREVKVPVFSCADCEYSTHVLPSRPHKRHTDRPSSPNTPVLATCLPITHALARADRFIAGCYLGSLLGQIHTKDRHPGRRTTKHVVSFPNERKRPKATQRWRQLLTEPPLTPAMDGTDATPATRLGRHARDLFEDGALEKGAYLWSLTHRC